MRLKAACWILVAAVVLAVPAVAGEAPPDGDENVLVTFLVGDVVKGKAVVHKTYEMIVTANGESVEMSTGARVPIPTTSFKVTEDGSKIAAPVTSYTYQHVGFSAKVRASLNADGSISLRGRIEDSSLTDTPTADGRPFIQSMNQHLSVRLADGVPLRVNSVEETGTRSFFMQVQADRLDEAGKRRARN